MTFSHQFMQERLKITRILVVRHDPDSEALLVCVRKRKAVLWKIVRHTRKCIPQKVFHSLPTARKFSIGIEDDRDGFNIRVFQPTRYKSHFLGTIFVSICDFEFDGRQTIVPRRYVMSKQMDERMLIFAPFNQNKILRAAGQLHRLDVVLRNRFNFSFRIRD